MSRLVLRTRVLWFVVPVLSCYQPTTSEPEVELRSIVSTPAQATLAPQGAQQFLAYAVTVAGDTTAVEVSWDASAGAIDEQGDYVAPAEAGDYLVVATHATKTWFADTSLVAVRTAGQDVASVRVTPATASVVVGGSVQLAAQALDAGGGAVSGLPVAWSVSDTTLAGVDGSGVVLGLGQGTVTVRATIGGVTGAATVEISAVPVVSVGVSPAAVSIATGASVRLAATARDSAGNVLSGRPVAWATSNPSVAGVDNEGNVTGLSAGTAQVTATIEGRSGSSSVTVTGDAPAAVDTVVVSPGNAAVAIGGTLQLDATVRDAAGNALEGRAVSWASLSPAVASVDSSGLVRGIAAGSATILATSEGRSGSAAVTVESVPAPVETVVVSPRSASLGVGDTLRLAASVLDAEGNVLSGRTVTWASLDTGVATIDASGLVRGAGAGSTTIVASSEGRSGSATVTVESAAAPVDSVAVSPNPAGVSVGNTLQLSATALDAAGNVVTGSSVTWSTANATVASVGETGVVTGNAAGATTISASIDGVVGSASVTVSEVSGSLANECATPQPGWVWCDDFDQDRLGSYFEYNNSNGGFTRASGVGNEGSTGMRVQFSTGQVSAGYLHLAIGRTPQSYFRPADDGTADYTELYWRVYVRNQPGWTGGGARKLSRAFIFASSDSWAQAMVAHVWAGKPPNQNYLYIEPVSGTDASGNLITTKYNDLENFEWLGARKGDTPLFDAPAIGQWHCVEARVTLNDSGASNGIFQLWVNGSLDVERTDLNFVDTYSGYGLNAVYLENYWNEGSPQDQERYLDNFVVSTQPIGCQ